MFFLLSQLLSENRGHPRVAVSNDQKPMRLSSFLPLALGQAGAEQCNSEKRDERDAKERRAESSKDSPIGEEAEEKKKSADLGRHLSARRLDPVLFPPPPGESASLFRREFRISMRKVKTNREPKEKHWIRKKQETRTERKERNWYFCVRPREQWRMANDCF